MYPVEHTYTIAESISASRGDKWRVVETKFVGFDRLNWTVQFMFKDKWIRHIVAPTEAEALKILELKTK